MRRRRYVYLMGDGLQATVIDSQVITILKRLAERGVVFELIAYQPRPAAADRERVERRLREVRHELRGTVRLWSLPAPPALVLPPRSAGEGERAAATGARGLGTYAARRVALWLRERLLEVRLLRHLTLSMMSGDVVVIHARGGAMRLGTRLKRWHPPRVRVVADFRGDRPAEYLYKMGTLDSPLARREHRALLAQDGEVVREADTVQCVSAALGRQLARDHRARPDRIRIVPCVADERRFVFDPEARARVRSAEGWTGREVVVYSGSMLAWQQPEAALTLCAHLRRSRPDVHLLVLTPDVEVARGLATRHGLDEAAVTIRAARHDEVGGFLCAADMALLLRERHPLNAVASPTKFAEYVLAGLPVLVSRGIGDLDDAVARLDLGALVDDHRETGELVAAARRLLDSPGDRAARAQAAQATFALGPYVDDWVRLYETI